MNKKDIKAIADRYAKVVEWSTEDACYVGRVFAETSSPTALEPHSPDTGAATTKHVKPDGQRGSRGL